MSLLNSLVGLNVNDRVGSGGVTALTNGNFVVSSPLWDSLIFVDTGAVTWMNGTTAGFLPGAVTLLNSLSGGNSGERIGSGGVTALAGGNYVVASPAWGLGAGAPLGAATWGSGATGTTGTVSGLNSLVGLTPNDQVSSGGVVALANGNYAVISDNWANGGVASAGAVTLGDGAAGTIGAVSTANSLVGTTLNDRVGSGGVTALSNGNYVVGSSQWTNGGVANAGAVTWGNGAAGTTGAVSAANSLVGATLNDSVGSGGVIALANGNYVAASPVWNNGAAAAAGAATWGNGAGGTVGAVSAANSLVGTMPNDNVGNLGVVALANGNYVVRSPAWNNGVVQRAGAATFGSGASGVAGAVSAANSLVGTSAMDQIALGGVRALPGGKYAVASPAWAGGRGAVTWGSGTSGVAGVVDAFGSFTGNVAGDAAGSGGLVPLANGSFVVSSPQFDTAAGADAGRVTVFAPGTAPLTFASNPAAGVSITPASITAITNTGTSVMLEASNDIVLSAGSNITTTAGGAGGAITLRAGRSIALGADIVTDNGNLTLVANESAANGVVTAQRDPGAASITVGAGRTIDAGAGSVSLTVADAAASGRGGAQALAGNITTGSGSSIAGGTVALRTAGLVDLEGSLAATGGVSMSAGALNVGPGGTLALGSAGAIATPSVTNAGTIRGNGTFAMSGGVFTNLGTLAPGASAGALVIDGNFVQGATGVLAIELGGTTAGVNHDLLTITGTATFGGTLGASLIGGHAPAPADVYKILSFSGWSGNFASLSLPAGAPLSPVTTPTSYLLVGPFAVAGTPADSAAASAAAANLTQRAVLVASTELSRLTDDASGAGDGLRARDRRAEAAEVCN